MRPRATSTRILAKTMRDAVRNKKRWEKARAPTQDLSTDLHPIAPEWPGAPEETMWFRVTEGTEHIRVSCYNAQKGDSLGC